MSKNISNTYVRTTVRLDNSEFIDCTFSDCVLEFGGTGPVNMSGCHFNKVKFAFVGAAKNTLGFMRAMYHGMGSGGRRVIDETFENLKKPPETVN